MHEFKYIPIVIILLWSFFGAVLYKPSVYKKWYSVWHVDTFKTDNDGWGVLAVFEVGCYITSFSHHVKSNTLSNLRSGHQYDCIVFHIFWTQSLLSNVVTLKTNIWIAWEHPLQNCFTAPWEYDWPHIFST